MHLSDYDRVAGIYVQYLHMRLHPTGQESQPIFSNTAARFIGQARGDCSRLVRACQPLPILLSSAARREWVGALQYITV